MTGAKASQHPKALKVFRIVIKYVKPYMIPFICSILLLSADMFFSVGMAWIQQFFIDTINASDKARLLNLIKTCSALGIGAIVFIVFQYFTRHFSQVMLTRDFTLDVFEKLNKVPFSFIQSKHSGDMTSRVTKDVEVTSGIVGSIIYDLGYSFLTCLIVFVYMARINFALTLVALGAGLLNFIVGRLFEKKMRDVSYQVQRKQADTRGVLQETLQGIKIIKIFGLQDEFLKKYIDERKAQNHLLVKQTLLGTGMSQIIDFIFNATAYSCAISIAFLSIQNTISAGEVFAFLVLTWKLQGPFLGISNMWGAVQQSVGAAGRVLEILDMKSESNSETILEKETDYSKIPLSVKDIVFSYSSEDGEVKSVFNHFKFQVDSDGVVAVVGVSGSGKSTLAKLCVGLYKPEYGDIEVFGKSIYSDLERARSLITYISQTPCVLPGTIRDNIAIADENASDEEIIQAAKDANIHDFIDSMENKYYTVIGEKGTTLSVGQKQRIAIARAFLRNSTIVIFDEPTSALDSQSEQLINQSIEKLAKNKSVIVISHKLYSVKNARHIVVLYNGQIVEQGTHENLMLNKGFYANLYNSQAYC
jgi:ATP-binding cassette subfamily B protein